MRDPVVVPRSTLYFHKWQYVILLLLPNASFLRQLHHKKIDDSINYRNQWLTRRAEFDLIGAEQREVLHDTCDYLLARANPYKKVVCGNGLWLYTNTPDDFDDISAIGQVLYINQAEISLVPGTVTLKRPRHAFRTYFRNRWLSNDELATLRRYFAARPTMFRQGPGFANVVTGRRMWLMNNHFVDHDEPNADFLINMAVPGIVRKTMPIIARTK
jgi:hypothetical protein